MVINIDTVMSIEEKAKAYDEAIRKIQEIIIMDNAPVTPKEIGEYLFPNLKESDDEKMLREIKRYIKEQGDKPTGLPNGNVAVGDMLAWLEKQEKSNFEQSIQDGDNIVTNEDGTHFNVSQLERVSQKVTNTKETAKKFLKSAGIMDKNGELADEYRLEKQDEQNPTDKFEPKFKVGDWITDGYLYYKITDVLEDRYIVDRKFAKERCAILFKFEHYYHLWSLKDAKDGDVLAFDNDNIVIFKDLYNYTSFHSYCHIEDGIFDFSTDGLPDWWEDEGFKPATKEQCDLLFQKMKKAGYDWDADKKELKIIDWSKHIKYDPNGPSIFTKKSTWSEEDENMLKSIIATCELAEQDRDSSPARHLFEMQSNWLKSIKERLKGEDEEVITKEEKDLLLKDLEWCDMETNECHCYNCELFDSKNNVCKCIDLCKRPKNTYKGFYIK